MALGISGGFFVAGGVYFLSVARFVFILRPKQGCFAAHKILSRNCGAGWDIFLSLKDFLFWPRFCKFAC